MLVYSCTYIGAIKNIDSVTEKQNEKQFKTTQNRKNLTQKELCKEIKEYGLYIDRSTYTKYELGERNISCDKLYAFADFFETTIDEILRQS